jgi:REP element-mobilizing transposase RayT
MHLRRLLRIFVPDPQFVVTTCTEGRRRLLADPRVHRLLLEEWIRLRERHGWEVGRYVVMPDHVHLFMRRVGGGRRNSTLSEAVGGWKEWSAKRMLRELELAPPIWQREFFDEVVDSDDVASRRWNYIRRNPERAGLVGDDGAWPFAGAVHFESRRVALERPKTGC